MRLPTLWVTVLLLLLLLAVGEWAISQAHHTTTTYPLEALP